MIPTRLCQLLHISFPLLQAGMGGVASARLAAAVSNSGGLGIVALYKHRFSEVSELIRETRALTPYPFGVNLIPEVVTESVLQEQVQAVLRRRDPGICFTFFGLPPSGICYQIGLANHLILIQVGSVSEAYRAEALRADALIIQGQEAGGHLLGATSLADLLSQLQQLGLRLPLVAAGGIAVGRDFARVCALGASGCMCGTLFVATEESSAHLRFKEHVVRATASDTVVTHLFAIGWPGRAHRVLHTEIIDKGGELPSSFIGITSILGKTYWIPRFSAAVPTETTEGEIEQMAMYCGTSCYGVHAIRPVAEVVREFRQEAESTLKVY